MPPTEGQPSEEEKVPASQPAVLSVRGPDVAAVSSKPLTMRALVWRRYKRHVPAMISSAVLLILILMAIFAPQVTGALRPLCQQPQALSGTTR